MTERRPSPRGVDAHQRRVIFVAAYLRPGPDQFKANKAAIEAGFSAKSARSSGARLLCEPWVEQKIAAAARRVSVKAELDAESVLAEVRGIVKNDPRRFFRDDGTMKAPSEWDDDMAAAVASVEALPVVLAPKTAEAEATIGHAYKLKFWNKNDAIDKAMRFLGLFEKDNKQRQENLLLQINLVGAPDIGPAPLEVKIVPNLIDGRR